MRIRRLLFLVPLIAIAAFLSVRVAMAQEGDGERSPFDENCLRCHADTDATTTFEDGDSRSVQFHTEGFDQSIHGMSNESAGLSCYDCHGDYTFPHEGGPWETARDFRFELNAACERCHSHQAELQSDSTHALALAEGNQNAAVCVDCHGYHDVTQPDVPRSKISQTCGSCHTDIFAQYAGSVHGEALLNESNPDVPTCVNCHGVHNIEDPTTNLFRLRSPQICAQCHANDELMEKYGISTHVFDTYVADFHGTTVTLFADQAPDAEVNKAVCYDCHGVHNILAPDNPESTVVADNLVETCRKCHPDASPNFAESWTKHYEPNPQKFPLVFFVDQFYKLFIPGILGFFAIVIIPDTIRRIVNSGKEEH